MVGWMIMCVPIFENIENNEWKEKPGRHCLKCGKECNWSKIGPTRNSEEPSVWDHSAFRQESISRNSEPKTEVLMPTMIINALFSCVKTSILCCEHQPDFDRILIIKMQFLMCPVIDGFSLSVCLAPRVSTWGRILAKAFFQEPALSLVFFLFLFILPPHVPI